MDKFNKYAPPTGTQQTPPTQPKVPSAALVAKRKTLMQKQPHKRSLSLNQPTKPVKTATPPSKVDVTGWTKKMDRDLDVLLKNLSAGQLNASEFIRRVGAMLGEERGYQHGDRQVIYAAVREKSWQEQQRIAENTQALIPHIAEPLANIVGKDIHDAATHALAAQQLSMPQDPAPKAPSTLATSNPPTVQDAKKDWESRGKTAMIAFLFALEGIDEQAKLNAFYGTKGLWVVIKEVTDQTGHADVSELDGWIDHALEGRSKQEIDSIVKSLTEGFGAKGDIYFNVRARLFRQADLLRRKEAGWNARGMRHTKQVVAALLTGDTKELKNAFYDPGYNTEKYGEDPKLYEMIKDQDPARQKESFDRWVGEALKGCSIDELTKISKTIEQNKQTLVCHRGGVFQELEIALDRNIEHRLADEFVSTVLKGGDIGQAADQFFAAVRQSTLGDDRLMHGRMVALIAANLSLVNIATLKERCRDLPAYGGVTALRECLGMIDPKAVENLFGELAKGDLTENGTLRLRALFRLADDQLRLGEGADIKSRIEVALKDLKPQQTIAIVASLKKLPQSENGLYPYLVGGISAAISKVAPQYFIEECLAYRPPPIEALGAMESITTSAISLAEGGPIQLTDALENAINQALRGLRLEDLVRLSERLSESDMTKVDMPIVNRFSRLAAKEVENRFLLPKPLNSQ